MNKQDADTLIQTIRGLVEPPLSAREPGALRPEETAALKRGNGKIATAEDLKPHGLNADQVEALYLQFKRRFIEEAALDPVLLHLLTVRPEIVVEVDRQVVTIDTAGLRGRVARLLAQGWFTTTRATSAVRRELARTGADPGGGGSLSDTLNGYVRDGFLSREGDGFLVVPGVTVTERTIEK